MIRLYLPRIYHGYTINSCHAIRVTRDADLTAPVGRDEDLLTAIEESLRDRRMGTAVRLQYDVDLPADILATIVDALELEPADLYEARGFIAFADLFQLYGAVDLPRLRLSRAGPGAARPDRRDPRCAARRHREGTAHPARRDLRADRGVDRAALARAALGADAAGSLVLDAVRRRAAGASAATAGRAPCGAANFTLPSSFRNDPRGPCRR